MTIRFENPKVTIIAATEKDPLDAAALLIFTKNTRLQMRPGGLEEVKEHCTEDPGWMRDQLDYMSKTIRSSWEFLDVTFLIENVSRACAQQITRTRQASFAMQSQRVTDMGNASFSAPGGDYDGNTLAQYSASLSEAMENYEFLIDSGLSFEDARGVLPMNVQCNLVAKYNFRTLASLIPARTSYRAQGEYRQVAEQMRHQLFAMWPWAELFFRPRNEAAERLLDELELVVEMDHVMNTKLQHELLILVAKVRDQISSAE